MSDFVPGHRFRCAHGERPLVHLCEVVHVHTFRGGSCLMAAASVLKTGNFCYSRDEFYAK